MSVDFYLYSPSYKKATMVGSIGLSGPKSWPVEYGGRSFIKWAIENSVRDVILVDENQLEYDEENGDLVDNFGTRQGNGV